jgi:hypothetical protein
MDVSDLRKRILQALDTARKDATSRRTVVDEANRAFEQFVEAIAVPLLRQAQAVLRAEHQPFTVHHPAGGARLVSDNSADTFLEFAMDTGGARPQVVGRVSLTRGRQSVVVEERPISTTKAIADLTEDDVAQFLVTEIPKLVVKP